MPVVTLTVMDDEIVPAPVEDVVVEFYTAGAVFVTSETTDEDGLVTVTLPEDDYDVLFYRPGISILPKQPQRIEVQATDNDFTVTCHRRTLPETIDPRRTRVTGHFLGVDGGLAKERIVFTTKKDLLVYVTGVITLDGRFEVASNEEGYFDFELLRNTEYDVRFIHLDTLLGQAAGKLCVKVPDGPAIELEKLLFPLPQSLSFSESAITLVAGAGPDESVQREVLFSDGSSRIGGVPWASITLTNTDNTVVEAAFRDGVLCLTPLSPGVATISSTRAISSYAFWEEVPAYVTDTIVVTVTA